MTIEATDPAAASADGAMSLDDAMSALGFDGGEELPREDDAPGGAEGAAEPEGAGGQGEAQEPASGEPEGAEAHSAPDDWSDEDKAWFSELAPERQALLAARAAPAAAVDPQAVAAREALQAQTQRLSETNTRLSELVGDRAKAFEEKWGKITPDMWRQAAVDDPDGFTAAKAQMEYEAGELRRIEGARQEADAQELRLNAEALARDLPSVAPELTDIPTLTKTVEYLKGVGVPAAAIPRASAIELALAHKAMLYDQGVKALSAKPAAKTPPPAKPTPRPSAAPAGSPAQRSAAAVKNRFAQTGSLDDAAALLLTMD